MWEKKKRNSRTGKPGKKESEKNVIDGKRGFLGLMLNFGQDQFRLEKGVAN